MKTIEELKKLIQAGEEAKRELEERGRVKFREGEIVIHIEANRPDMWFDFMAAEHRKLTIEEIVLSMAPPEAVRWGMGGSTKVDFYSGDTWFDSMVIPDHMARDDWQSVGGEL